MEKNYVVMTDSSADLNPALEQELGVTLLVRSRSGVALTYECQLRRPDLPGLSG